MKRTREREIYIPRRERGDEDGERGEMKMGRERERERRRRRREEEEEEEEEEEVKEEEVKEEGEERETAGLGSQPRVASMKRRADYGLVAESGERGGQRVERRLEPGHPRRGLGLARMTEHPTPRCHRVAALEAIDENPVQVVGLDRVDD